MEDPAGNIGEQVEVLERHRKQCEADGRYEEAENARLRLAQLIQFEDQRRRDELRSQQLAERLGVEEAHMRELSEFNTGWDERCGEFEAHANGLQSSLTERHRAEHGVFLEKARAETQPRAPRWSRELLNLRHIQESLAKQKKYAEASQIQSQSETLEKKEVKLWKDKRELRIASLEQQFLQKQRLEMGGLLKRIQTGRDEQRQARKAELERLLQRYNNVKIQLENQQSIIRLRAERFPMASAQQ